MLVNGWRSDVTVSGRVATALRDAAKDYRDGLRSLLRCPREIWIAYAVKVMESLAYFASVLILMAFLTQDMGLSDEMAGTIFGVWSASMSFFMLFVGFVADSMGIRKALTLGLFIALLGRVAISTTTEPWVVYPGLFLLSVGFAYMIPLLAAAVKLFSTKRAQKYAFSWYYVVMNIGAFFAGISRDWLRETFTEPISLSVAGLDLTIRPLQIIFSVAVIATLFSILLVLFFIREEIPAEELADGDEEAAVEAAEAQRKNQNKSALMVMREVIAERSFWIFIAFIGLLVLVKMIFQYNHSLYPLYMERIGFDEWMGTLYAINPLIIIFLVPVMTALTSNMRAYVAITLGAFIAASSVFFMGFGESIALIVMFQVVLSIGEAIYSPRIYEYTASVAPAGKESSYMAYSKAPMFFAKVAAGPLSGILLAQLCAEGSTAATRNTELMWILVGASTMISPVALLLLRRWLDVEKVPERSTERPEQAPQDSPQSTVQ